MRKNWIAVLAAVLLAACSSAPVYISPDYSGRKIENANLIIPTVDDVKISQDENLFDENEIALFRNAYLELLGAAFKDALKSESDFSTVNYVQFKQLPDFKTENFRIDEKESVSIGVPGKKFDLKTEGQNFILFLQDLRLFIERQEQETSDPAKHYNVSTASPGGEAQLSNRKLIDHFIKVQMKYALYDNANGKVVSCGLLSEKEKYAENKNFESYLNSAFSSFAGIIIKNSPFNKK